MLRIRCDGRTRTRQIPHLEEIAYLEVTLLTSIVEPRDKAEKEANCELPFVATRRAIAS